MLDLAAGLGDTGFLALPGLHPSGRLVTTDVAPEMVDAARRRARELGLEQGDQSFAVEDAAALSFPDASFDCVVFRWGLMLVPDMDAAARELARVLRPGGRAAVAVWADPDANDWMTVAGRSALELGLLARPAPDEPGPFRLSADGALSAVLDRGGLAVQHVEDVPLTWRAESLTEWWEAARDTSRMLGRLLERVSTEDVERIRVGAVRRLAEHVRSDGSVAVPGRARVAVATRAAA